MHLVFVSSLVPAGRPQSEFEIANQAIVDGLRRAGARVSFLGFRRPGAELSDPQDTACLGEFDPDAGPASAVRELRRFASAAASGLTVSSDAMRIVTDTELRGALSRLEPFDGIVLGGVSLAGAFETVFAGRPCLLVAHAVEHILAAENARGAPSLLERFRLSRDARVLKTLERRLCGSARFVLAVSEEDRAGLGVADDRSLALPLVIPRDAAPTGVRLPGFDIGMIGDWIAPESLTGLEWFLQDVLPKLHPHVTFAIAGRVPRGFPSRDKRVLFLGPVVDHVEFLRQCRVIALPAQAKTGVQMAAVQTLELGLPAVATSASLRGIAALPENVRRADGPKKFAAALQDLVVSQRTGMLPDADGEAFRAARLTRMDEVLAEAMNKLVSKSVPQR